MKKTKEEIEAVYRRIAQLAPKKILIPDEVNTYDEMFEYLLTISQLGEEMKESFKNTYKGKVDTLHRIMKQKDEHIQYLTARIFEKPMKQESEESQEDLWEIVIEIVKNPYAESAIQELRDRFTIKRK